MTTVEISWNDGRGRPWCYSQGVSREEHLPLAYEKVFHEFLFANKSKRYKELPIFKLRQRNI